MEHILSILFDFKGHRDQLPLFHARKIDLACLEQGQTIAQDTTDFCIKCAIT